MKCKICSSQADSFSSATILQKYPINYFRCRECGFLQTEEPYWLEEAYSTAITGSDVGMVQRNLHLAGVAAVLISTFWGKADRFVDYAGGYGLFVRLMRDRGFAFNWHDKYCDNLFAKGLESPPETEPYDLLTAFEVFEHLANPMEEISGMLTLSDSILFTTQLLPDPPPKPEQWWFYGVEHGQHISFYSKASLVAIAGKLGMNLYTNGKSMHLLTRKRLSDSLFFLLARHKVARFLAPLCRRPSLLTSDFQKISGRGF